MFLSHPSSLDAIVETAGLIWKFCPAGNHKSAYAVQSDNTKYREALTQRLPTPRLPSWLQCYCLVLLWMPRNSRIATYGADCREYYPSHAQTKEIGRILALFTTLRLLVEVQFWPAMYYSWASAYAVHLSSCWRMRVATIFDTKNRCVGIIREDNGKYFIDWVDSASEPPGKVLETSRAYNSLQEAEGNAFYMIGVIRIDRD